MAARPDATLRLPAAPATAGLHPAPGPTPGLPAPGLEGLPGRGAGHRPPDQILAGIGWPSTAGRGRWRLGSWQRPRHRIPGRRPLRPRSVGCGSARRPAAPTPPRGAANATGDGPPPLAGQARPAAPSAGIDLPVGSEAGQPPPRPSKQPRAERGAVSSPAGAAATPPASGSGAGRGSGSRIRKRSARGSPGGGRGSTQRARETGAGEAHPAGALSRAGQGLRPAPPGAGGTRRPWTARGEARPSVHNGRARARLLRGGGGPAPSLLSGLSRAGRGEGPRPLHKSRSFVRACVRACVVWKTGKDTRAGGARGRRTRGRRRSPTRGGAAGRSAAAIRPATRPAPAPRPGATRPPAAPARPADRPPGP